MKAPCTLAVLLLAAHAGSAGAECAAQSGALRTPLVELYTSEGCDSCPPADRWLRELRAAGVVPKEAVALAFHVDYWDRLGWRDRYGDARHGERQRAAAGRAGARTVYTPQVFVDGRELRNWRALAPRAGAFAADAPPARAQIALRSSRLPDAIEVQIDANAQDAAGRGARVFVALYENALASEVRAGENAGLRLEHDFVVRELVGPLALDAAGRLAQRIRFPAHRYERAEHAGIAAFVESARGEPLQALALSTCKPG